MKKMVGSDEIKVITGLLDEIQENYYDLMRMLDDLEESNVENALDENYKKVIDAIKGIKEYN